MKAPAHEPPPSERGSPESRHPRTVGHAAALERCPPIPSAYTGFFECFNRGAFYEAHDVLEALWLRVRREPVGDFYKGLIQVAGAFVHLQKGRLPPAVSLFRLADGYLAKYPAVFEQLDVGAARKLIQQWKAGVEAGDGNPFLRWPHPRLELISVV